jgi:hypothetical protein
MPDNWGVYMKIVVMLVIYWLLFVYALVSFVQENILSADAVVKKNSFEITCL